MPVVKIPTSNAVAMQKKTFVQLTSNPLGLDDDYTEAYSDAPTDPFSLWDNDDIPYELFEAPHGIIAVNGDADGVDNWVAGSAGGLFLVQSDGICTFDPAGEFDSLPEGETIITSVACTHRFGGWQATTTIYVTVSVYVTPVDPMWEDVEFLYQLPPAIYTISDRAENHATVKTGNIDWLWDSTFPNVIGWQTTTKSYLRIGASDALRGFCNGSFSWTFDAWFYPYNIDGAYLFSISENTTSKNQLTARVVESNLVFTLFATKVIFTLSIPITLYAWQHVALTLDLGTSRAYAFLNGKLIEYGVYDLNLPFVDQPVSYAYLGIDNPSYNWFYRGRIAAARLTKGARWVSNFTPPQPPYPEVAS